MIYVIQCAHCNRPVPPDAACAAVKVRGDGTHEQHAVCPSCYRAMPAEAWLRKLGEGFVVVAGSGVAHAGHAGGQLVAGEDGNVPQSVVIRERDEHGLARAGGEPGDVSGHDGRSYA